jgi:hypothetical protein
MTVTSESTTSTRTRTLGAAMVVTLLGQLLLGMANTFWLTLPDSGSGWKAAAPMGLLMAHITLGVALVVLAAWIAVVAFRENNRSWLMASAVGILGIVMAVGGGTAFMGQTSNDGASFSMAIGNAVALGAYALGLYRLPVTSTT